MHSRNGNGRRTRALRTVKLILPFKLPTWNQLFRMTWRERKAIRTWIHDAVLRCTISEPVLQTPTASVLKLSLTDLELQKYSLMMDPSLSRKSRLARKKSEVSSSSKQSSQLPSRIDVKQYKELIGSGLKPRFSTTGLNALKASKGSK